MTKIKSFLAFIILQLIALQVIAQQNHFVYIQADNKQPFYIKLNDKIYSSSATGYILLSKLVENNYNISIGFPKKEWPEQKLSLSVQKNDLGYLLKNFEEKGWGLVDLNTFQILYSNSQSNTTNASNEKVKTFEEKEKIPIVKIEETKIPEIKGQEKSTNKAEVIIEKSQQVKVEETKPIEKVVIDSKTTIRKLFTSKSNNDIEIVYVVKNNTTLDTVRVSLPINEMKSQATPEAQQFKSIETISQNEVITTPIPTVAKPGVKQIEEQPKQVENPIAPQVKTVIKSNPKNNCTSIASEEDYKKLRKKMVSADSDNEMLYKASSIFQKQCYTTEQIKTLSYLFLTDEGKYKFLDAAYPYISDAQSFSRLVSILTDEYYIKRFNTMLKN